MNAYMRYHNTVLWFNGFRREHARRCPGVPSKQGSRSQACRAAKPEQSRKTLALIPKISTSIRRVRTFAHCVLTTKDSVPMTYHARIRGLMAAQADTNPNAILGDLTQAFATFKQNHANEISEIRNAVDDLNGSLAAQKIGPSGGDVSPVESRRANAAFTEFMRTGKPDAMVALSPRAEMSTDSDPGGGYTVPKEIDKTIQNQLVEVSPIRRLASVVTTGTSDYHKLVNKRGASSGWVGERETRSETDTPLLADIAPPMGEIYAHPFLTNWMMDDSQFNLDNFIRENITDEMSLQEGAAFVTGTGINQPRGFMTLDTALTADSSRDFGTLQYTKTSVAAAISDGTYNGVDALIDVVYSLKSSYRAGPGVGWLMNSTTASVIRKLKTIGDTANYLWQASAQMGQPDRLLGYPVYESEDMPDIGANAYPVAFGNWRRGYVVVDRIGTRVIRDQVTKPGWTKFYITKRVGGAPLDSNAIKLLKCEA